MARSARVRCRPRHDGQLSSMFCTSWRAAEDVHARTSYLSRIVQSWRTGNGGSIKQGAGGRTGSLHRSTLGSPTPRARPWIHHVQACHCCCAPPVRRVRRPRRVVQRPCRQRRPVSTRVSLYESSEVLSCSRRPFRVRRVCGSSISEEKKVAAEAHFHANFVPPPPTALVAAATPTVSVYFHVISKDSTTAGGNIPYVSPPLPSSHPPLPSLTPVCAPATRRSRRRSPR